MAACAEGSMKLNTVYDFSDPYFTIKVSTVMGVNCSKSCY